MKYLNHWKPDILVSTDKDRPQITECFVMEKEFSYVKPYYVDREAGERPCLIIATDGRIMAVFAAVLEPGDVPGFVSPRVFSYARETRDPVQSYSHIMLKKKYARMSDGTLMPRSKLAPDAKFYDITPVFPPEDQVSVGLQYFSPVFMAILADALGYRQDSNAVFSCRAVTSREPAICRILQSEYSQQAVGVIMPQRNFMGE